MMPTLLSEVASEVVTTFLATSDDKAGIMTTLKIYQQPSVLQVKPGIITTLGFQCKASMPICVISVKLTLWCALSQWQITVNPGALSTYLPCSLLTSNCRFLVMGNLIKWQDLIGTYLSLFTIPNINSLRSHWCKWNMLSPGDDLLPVQCQACTKVNGKGLPTWENLISY